MFSYISEESVEKPKETVKHVGEEMLEEVSDPKEAPAKVEEAASAPEEVPAKVEDVVAEAPAPTLAKCTPGFSCTIM